jgi:hypothetical protein
VVDILSAITATTSVNGPFGVDIADTFLARRASSALGLSEGDPFSHVLSDLLVSAEVNGGETSLAVDAGLCDQESWREALIHLRKLIPLFTSKPIVTFKYMISASLRD